LEEIFMYFSARSHPDNQETLKELVAAGRGSRGGRILLPVDGSPASLRAADYVERNLRGSRVGVHVLNVQRPFLPDPGLSLTPGLVAEAHADGERALGRALPIFSAHRGEITSEVAFGSEPETIARVAEERGCSLIVMGTRARHPLVDLFNGGVPSRAARISAVPVLLVRHKEELPCSKAIA
jgi:nucleotide-binding universal stress UspA family protein